MRIADALSLSLRMFRARALRTFLTVLGMGVGIGAILFLVSIGYGLQNALLERITTSDSLLTLDVVETKLGAVSMDNEAIRQFGAMEGVSEVSPALRVAAQASSDDVTTDMSVVATLPSQFRLGGMRLEKGSALSDDTVDTIVVSTTLASVFSQNPEELLGHEMRFLFLPVTSNDEEGGTAVREDVRQVEGDRSFIVSGIVQSDEMIAYVHLDAVKNLEIQRYTSAKVKCANNDVMQNVRDAILEKGFLVSSLSDTVDQANKIFQGIQLILLSFGVIALVVSAIGMFNTMTIALLERTEEIGIMKSIGAFNHDVAILFVLESTLMGLLGGLGGVLLGQVGGEVMNALLNVVATRFGGQVVDIFYSPGWFVALIIGLGAAVGFMTGFIPAMRASKIDPLDALRYK